MVSTWEDLRTELAADVAISGELRHQMRPLAPPCRCRRKARWTPAQAIVHRNVEPLQRPPRARHQISSLFSQFWSLSLPTVT